MLSLSKKVFNVWRQNLCTITNIKKFCCNGSAISNIHQENKSKNVYIETHGCQMNFNDSGIALSILQDAGFKKVESLEKAGIVLYMTCAIRDGAENKIWNKLKSVRNMKGTRNHLTVGVLGCMAERLKKRLLESDEARVDVVCGPDAYRDLPRLLTAATTGAKGMNVALSLEETYADVTPVRVCSSVTGEGLPSAFVSVMRGCDNMCTYCIVPFTRGRERSRNLESIVDEVKKLRDQGVREVVLLGQNVNSYRDTSLSSSSSSQLATGFKTVYKPKIGGRRFGELLEAVSDIDPNIRVRFTSPHPKDFPDDVLHLIKERVNICNQLHLPAQSGSSSMLERMGRGYSREAYLNLVDKARSIIPNVALTSDFIAGFCGETEEEHQETLSLIKKVIYNFVFCFPYSMREKTRAFHRLVDDVPEEVKNRRHMELVSEFRKGSLQKNEAQIGNVQLVLVEGTSRRSSANLAGRNESNTRVIFSADPLAWQKQNNVRDIVSGDYVAVQITEASSQVLKGVSLYRSDIVSFKPSQFHSQKAIQA